MLIFFTGVDCSGKDSIRHALSESCNYEPFISSRSPICNIVYDVIFERITNQRLNNNEILIKNLLKLNAYFVLITVDPEILIARAKARNEKHVNDLKTFKEHQKIFITVFSELKESFKQYENQFIEVSNSKTLNDVVKKIKRKIK